MGTEIDGTLIEDDSITGDDVKEETLVLSKIPFSDPSFTSSNTKDAIIEAKYGITIGSIYGKLDKDITIETDDIILCHNIVMNGFNILLKGSVVLI